MRVEAEEAREEPLGEVLRLGLARVLPVRDPGVEGARANLRAERAKEHLC